MMKQEFWPLWDPDGANNKLEAGSFVRELAISIHIGLLPHVIKSKSCLWLVLG